MIMTAFIPVIAPSKYIQRQVTGQPEGNRFIFRLAPPFSSWKYEPNCQGDITQLDLINM